MSILENLWYGNIHPMEQGSFKTELGREYSKLFDQHQSKLFETIDDEEKATFDKLHDTWMKIQEIAERESFITGFSLAVQIMAEATMGTEFSTN